MKVYFEHIYEHIGYLFYALASERGSLDVAGYKKLQRMIDIDLASDANEVRDLKSDFADYIFSGLNEAFHSGINAEQAFEHFKNYFSVHSMAFSGSLKRNILATANTIASEFPDHARKSGLIPELENLLEIKRAKVF